MFSSLFLSKNQKLVKKWKKDHEKIVLLTHRVIAEYSKNNHTSTKKALVELNNLAIDHITNENVEFYKLLKNNNKFSNKNKKQTEEFIESFKETKMTLMQFLTKYSRESTPLDDEFFTTLNRLADVLVERIAFEEENLYALMDVSKKEEKWEQLKREL